MSIVDLHVPPEHIVRDSQVHDHEPPPVAHGSVGTRDPNLPTYGFVSLAKLRELFQLFRVRCPHFQCEHDLGVPEFSIIHQSWSLRFRCPTRHTYGWTSTEMEMLHHVPDVVNRFYHAALTAGLGFTQLDEMFREAGLAPVSRTHFFAFQSGKNRHLGWIQAINQRWARVKSDVQSAVLARIQPGLNEPACCGEY